MPDDERGTVELSEMIVEVTQLFHAPIADVWGLLSNVEQMAGLGPEHVEAHWLDPGPTVGARFTGKNNRDGFEWEVPCHIIDCDPPFRLTWTVLEPENPSSVWSYALTPEGDGTSVVQRFQHGPNYSFIRLWAEEQPERAAEIVSERMKTLQGDMRITLSNAAQLLSRGSSHS